MNDDLDNDLEKTVQQRLRGSEQELDAATLTQLRKARQRATALAEQRAGGLFPQSWLPVATAAGALGIAVTTAMYLSSTEPTDDNREGIAQPVEMIVNDDSNQQSNPDVALNQLSALDTETSLLLAEELLQTTAPDFAIQSDDADELIDLYENLEFYEWLLTEELDETAS